MTCTQCDQGTNDGRYCPCSAGQRLLAESERAHAWMITAVRRYSWLVRNGFDEEAAELKERTLR